MTCKKPIFTLLILFFGLASIAQKQSLWNYSNNLERYNSSGLISKSNSKESKSAFMELSSLGIYDLSLYLSNNIFNSPNKLLIGISKTKNAKVESDIVNYIYLEKESIAINSKIYNPNSQVKSIQTKRRINVTNTEDYVTLKYDDKELLSLKEPTGKYYLVLIYRGDSGRVVDYSRLKLVNNGNNLDKSKIINFRSTKDLTYNDKYGLTKNWDHDDWNSVSISNIPIKRKTNFSINQVKINSTGNSIFGLTYNSKIESKNNILCGILFENDKAFGINQNNKVTDAINFKKGDEFKISVVNSRVYYLHNGIPFYNASFKNEEFVYIAQSIFNSKLTTGQLYLEKDVPSFSEILNKNRWTISGYSNYNNSIRNIEFNLKNNLQQFSANNTQLLTFLTTNIISDPSTINREFIRNNSIIIRNSFKPFNMRIITEMDRNGIPSYREEFVPTQYFSNLSSHNININVPTYVEQCDKYIHFAVIDNQSNSLTYISSKKLVPYTSTKEIRNFQFLGAPYHRDLGNASLRFEFPATICETHEASISLTYGNQDMPIDCEQIIEQKVDKKIFTIKGINFSEYNSCNTKIFMNINIKDLESGQSINTRKYLPVLCRDRFSVIDLRLSSDREPVQVIVEEIDGKIILDGHINLGTPGNIFPNPNPQPSKMSIQEIRDKYNNGNAPSLLHQDISIGRIGSSESGLNSLQPDNVAMFGDTDSKILTRNRNRLWRNSFIPYTIDQSKFTNMEINNLRTWLTELDNQTNLTIVELEDVSIFEELSSIISRSSLDYVNFTKRSIGERGYSLFIGRKGGKQSIRFGRNRNITQYDVYHEFLHAIGFWHEHNRPDRDDFIVVDFEPLGNLDASVNYGIKHTIQSNGMDYDYNSIMHYGGEIDTDGDRIAETTIMSRRDPLQINNCSGAGGNVGGTIMTDCDYDAINLAYPVNIDPTETINLRLFDRFNIEITEISTSENNEERADWITAPDYFIVADVRYGSIVDSDLVWSERFIQETIPKEGNRITPDDPHLNFSMPRNTTVIRLRLALREHDSILGIWETGSELCDASPIDGNSIASIVIDVISGEVFLTNSTYNIDEGDLIGNIYVDESYFLEGFEEDENGRVRGQIDFNLAISNQ